MEDCDLPSKGDSALFLVILMMAVAAMFVWVIATEALGCFAVMLFVLFSLFWLVMLYFAVINLMVRSRKFAFSEKGMTVYCIGNGASFIRGNPSGTSASARSITHPGFPMNMTLSFGSPCGMNGEAPEAEPLDSGPRSYMS